MKSKKIQNKNLLFLSKTPHNFEEFHSIRNSVHFPLLCRLNQLILNICMPEMNNLNFLMNKLSKLKYLHVNLLDLINIFFNNRFLKFPLNLV